MLHSLAARALVFVAILNFAMHIAVFFDAFLRVSAASSRHRSACFSTLKHPFASVSSNTPSAIAKNEDLDGEELVKVL